MKVTNLKGAVVAASLLLFYGHVWHSPRAAAQEARGRAKAGGGPGPAASRAKAIFDERCAKCHGRDGRGQTKLGEMLEPPDFADAGWQRGASDERMRDSIRDGVGQMPAFARKLSRREIAELVAYVRGFAKPGR